MKKNKNTLIKILLIICLLFGLYNFLNIIKWNKDNRDTSNLYQDIITNIEIEEIDGFNSLFINPDDDKNSSYWYYSSMKMIDVDFEDLSTKNNDVIGWIQVPGTNIDYPFVQTKDNKFYLNHSFDKSYNDAGWIFMDYRNNNLSDKNNILYGHARKDGTMFGSLKKTIKKDWFNNKDNHIVKISTPTENSIWQIFSIYYIETESYYITVNFKDDVEFQKYIDKSLSRSVYKFDANVNIADTILTLSTCYGETKKLVLQAKLIKKEIKSS